MKQVGKQYFYTIAELESILNVSLRIGSFGIFTDKKIKR